MRMPLWLGLVSTALFGTGLAWAAPVRVADGDCAGLNAAVDAPGDKTVLLAPRGDYRACGLGVHGRADVDAAGARLGRLAVASGGRLNLRHALIGPPAVPAAAKGSARSPSILPAGSASYLINEGELNLESCSIGGIAYGLLRSADSPMINNSGQLSLRNVTIADNRAYNGAGLIGSSGGSVQVLQSTLLGSAEGEQPFAPTLVGGVGTLRIGNSILSAPGGMLACGGAVASQGGNVLSDASCGAGAADRIGDAGLADAGRHGGLVDTLGLRAGSLAIDAGLPALCEAADARGAARAAAAGSRCDAGAYEYGGGSGLLADGGINGTYYNADSDGHYVMIQRIDERLALVTWSTFDQRGAAALIYGVGSIDGTKIHVAQAARNAGGVMQTDGVPRGQHADAWGTIDIDLARCSGGSFAYSASAPGFASGRFVLSRLVGLDDVQCSE